MFHCDVSGKQEQAKPIICDKKDERSGSRLMKSLRILQRNNEAELFLWKDKQNQKPLTKLTKERKRHKLKLSPKGNHWG